MSYYDRVELAIRSNDTYGIYEELKAFINSNEPIMSKWYDESYGGNIRYSRLLELLETAIKTNNVELVRQFMKFDVVINHMVDVCIYCDLYKKDMICCNKTYYNNSWRGDFSFKKYCTNKEIFNILRTAYIKNLLNLPCSIKLLGFPKLIEFKIAEYLIE